MEREGYERPDLKTLAELPSPIVFPASADKIGLLGPRIAHGMVEFYAIIEALNFSVRLAASPLPAGDDRRLDRQLSNIRSLADLFKEACARALPLLDKLPHEKSDAALKAAIKIL